MAITDERLKEIENATSQTTKGRWLVDLHKQGSAGDVYAEFEDGEKMDVAWGVMPRDSKFITIAKVAVPELLAEIKALRKKPATEDINDWCDECGDTVLCEYKTRSHVIRTCYSCGKDTIEALS